MKKGNILLNQAVKHLMSLAAQKERDLQMPGDGRYKPRKLRQFLGYDQWAGLLIIVEWFWLIILAKIGVMPKNDAKLLKPQLLFKLLDKIITTDQDAVEKETKHDILALLKLMREILPKSLHRWLHFCATSYDIINTAYALQIRLFFNYVFWPELKSLDVIWRRHIKKNAKVLQIGRTHLQHALPITVGFWQSGLHNQMINSARRAQTLSEEIPGKFTGAVGTSASQVALIKSKQGEKVLMKMLGLPRAEITTQITPPGATMRFYSEIAILSGVLANLGEDVRILQAPEFGEIISASSSSSAMSHKQANPIVAENLAGMHISVIAESLKTMLTLVSDLQRDLRWSNVMRSFSAAAVYNYQQILNAKKLFKGMKINPERCKQNFGLFGKIVVAELLHLYLQSQGIPEVHEFVNKQIAPIAHKSGILLSEQMDLYLAEQTDLYLLDNSDIHLKKAWQKIPAHIHYLIEHPEEYLGNAISISLKEADNKL